MSAAAVVFTVGVLGPAALYALRMMRFRRAWRQLPLLSPNLAPAPRSADAPALTVIIAARNEAANLPHLLADLGQQTYLDEGGNVEVIIADDHSTDDTASVVQKAMQASFFTLRLLRLAELPQQPTGKKAAVQAAIAAAGAPWVVFTDADCRVEPGWLAAHAAVAAKPNAQFVSGPVLLTGEGILAELQGVELAALVGVGAASIALGQPTMCNGANLSYRRSAFYAVQGFAGNAHVPSGDDEFLLHKLYKAYPGGVYFLKAADAIVRTGAQPTLRALLMQRVRWASKWRHYEQTAPRYLAVLVLLANMALLMGLIGMFFFPSHWPLVLAAWTLKLGADVWFLTPVLTFFRRRRWLLWLPVLQLAYAPYALAAGLLGLRGGYTWKDREIKVNR
ncbi:glycosyltransferase [Hymenobacter sp. GOD-10R]|uniref:glycosyltransferase n=1 Tax=Hymenobacter sp. GOD-10R TaxID=3093922 RepID=UPI002D7915D0|nr:glycosyltransferase [Hymenobacter sp. GOD-10R]WRQ26943.1 glycosyltransferase [Hymenobacter sp. GOD-10R]